jgi:hypothetical protein
MGVTGGDKSGGKIHNKMWIMWKSTNSNRFFVQCVRLTIIFSTFAGGCCGKRKYLGRNVTRMLIFYEFVELNRS